MNNIKINKNKILDYWFNPLKGQNLILKWIKHDKLKDIIINI